MPIEQRLVADSGVVLGGVVGAAKRFEDPETGQPVRKPVENRPDRIDASAAIRARGVHRSRNAEVQVLAQPVEIPVDLGEAGPALEGEPRIAGSQILQHDAAEIVFFDKAGGEPGFSDREADRLAQERGIVLVPADRHDQDSSFTTTPQRRLMLPRLGCVGFQAIRPEEGGSFLSSLRSRRASTPSRSSNTPMRRIVPTSP